MNTKRFWFRVLVVLGILAAQMPPAMALQGDWGWAAWLAVAVVVAWQFYDHLELSGEVENLTELHDEAREDLRIMRWIAHEANARRDLLLAGDPAERRAARLEVELVESRARAVAINSRERTKRGPSFFPDGINRSNLVQALREAALIAFIRRFPDFPTPTLDSIRLHEAHIGFITVGDYYEAYTDATARALHAYQERPETKVKAWQAIAETPRGDRIVAYVTAAGDLLMTNRDPVEFAADCTQPEFHIAFTAGSEQYSLMASEAGIFALPDPGAESRR